MSAQTYTARFGVKHVTYPIQRLSPLIPQGRAVSHACHCEHTL